MCPAPLVLNWFDSHQYLALWLEGIALLAIFIWDRRDAFQQHKQTLAQMEIMQNQAGATVTAATAALLNAQAVVNTERPWMVVTWASDNNVKGLLRLGCRNAGNTPARVISMSAKPRFIDKLDNLPLPPDYSFPITMPDLRLIVHNDNFEIGHGISPESIIRDAGKSDLVNSSREFLVYYGNVVYRDILYPDSSPEGLHETRWCFVYQPTGQKRLVRSGPEPYNRYT